MFVQHISSILSSCSFHTNSLPQISFQEVHGTLCKANCICPCPDQDNGQGETSQTKFISDTQSAVVIQVGLSGWHDFIFFKRNKILFIWLLSCQRKLCALLFFSFFTEIWIMLTILHITVMHDASCPPKMAYSYVFPVTQMLFW